MDVYFEPVAAFEIPPYGALLGFGVTGFKHEYGGTAGNILLDGRYSIKGVVISASMIDDSLPDIPAIIVFERFRTNYAEQQVSENEIKDVLETFDLIRSYVTGDLTESEKAHEKETLGPHETPESNETPEAHESPEPHETHEAPTPTPTETQTPSPETSAPLQSLTLEISPGSITANPGDTINLRLRVDWEPKDWKGKADVKIVLSAAGFKKEYELPDVILENPPIEEEFSYTLPSDIPPLTYEATIVVEAGGQKAEDSVQIKVGASGTPGFDVVVSLLGLIVAMSRLMKNEKK